MGAGFVRILLLGFIVVLLSGCSRDREDLWLSVGDESVYRAEAMLYLLQVFNDFEEYGGEDVWLIEDFSGGKSASEVAKQGAVDNLIKNKVLAEKAEESGVEISESVRSTLRDEAKAYYEQLPEAFVVSNNIDIDTVHTIFIDNYLADTVTAQTMADYVHDPKEVKARIESNEDYARLSILDPVDILTTFRVHHLVVRTHDRDAQDSWQPLSEDAQAEAEQSINALYEKLLNGEDFVEIVKNNSDTDYYETQPEGLVLNRAQLPSAYLNDFENLEEGHMTQVIQGDYGYHIFFLTEKTVPTAEVLASYKERFLVWEEALADEAENALSKEAFDNIYSRWRDVISIFYSQTWNELDFLETVSEFNQSGSDQ